MKESDLGMKLISYIFLIFVLMVCIIPMLIVISVSLSEGNVITLYGYSILPKQFSFEAYKYIWKYGGNIWNAYIISIVVTVVGTLFGLLFTAQFSYALSRKNYKYKNILSKMAYFTMLFSGGMIPSYILVTQYLHLKNTLFVLIILGMISPWNVLLIKSFFEETAEELLEAAYLDGASEYTIFYKIIMPISTPVLATIACYLSLGYWNDWQKALLYITESRLQPLQYLLYKMSMNLEEMQKQLSYFGGTSQYFPSEPVRMAMAVVATGPIFLIFAFMQKYFVSGITVGSVKG